MKKNDVVKFHTPMADESPNSRYLLRDDPEESRKHEEKVHSLYPNHPRMKPRVDIEYLGEVVDGKLVPTTMFLRPIQTVPAEDLTTDESFVVEDHGAEGFAVVPAK